MPLARTVTPKVLPLPLGVATMTWLLGQVALTFQVALTRAGEGTVMVTVQLSEPDTDTLRLYRSPHTCPADRVAVQAPDGGAVVVGLLLGVTLLVGVGVVPPSPV